MSVLVLPGTSGEYVSTDDVNLLDADTAHCYQSYGQWSGSNISKVSGEDTFSGGAARVEHYSTGHQYMSVASHIPVTAGGEYSCTVRVRFDPFTDVDSVTLVADWRDSGDGNTGYSSSATLPIVDGDYLEVTFTATAPASSTYVLLVLDVVLNASSAPTYQYASDLCVRPGSDASFVPSLRIVGDLDMRAQFAPVDATPASAEYLLSCLASNTGFAMSLGTGGELVVYHGTGTTNRQETSSGLSISDDETVEVQSTFVKSTGVWTHYKNGTQFDTSPGFSTAAGSPSGTDLVVGAVVGGASGNFDGDIDWVEVRDGIDGPLVASMQPDDYVIGP